MRSSLLAALPLALLALLAPRLGRAGEPGVIVDLSHDFVVLPPPAPGLPPKMVTIENPYRLAVYLNFDGAKLTAGGSSSKDNKTDLIDVASLDYPAIDWTKHGGKDQGSKAVVDELKLMFMNYAVEFVTTRPTSGDYTMAMIGGAGESCKGDGSAAVGISPLDCKNSNKNDIVLIFAEKLGSPKQIAQVVAHELGHSFGLEHVQDKTSVMYPALVAETCCWVSSAVEPPSTCGRTTQDDAKVLLDNLGPGDGDAVPPGVWFLRPGLGAVLAPNFSFEVGAADDLRLHHVTLFVDGVKKVELKEPPYAAFVTNLSDGVHTLKAEVADYKPNLTSVELQVTVDSRCVAGGTCTAGLAELTGECSDAVHCASGLCAQKDGKGACTVACDPATKLCPAGTSCEGAAGAAYCTSGGGWTVLKAEGGGGGCDLAGRGGGAGLALALVLLAWLLITAAPRGRRAPAGRASARERR